MRPAGSRGHPLEKVSVEEEEDGQVELLAGEDPLLLEAKALDLGKVGSDDAGNDLSSGGQEVSPNAGCERDHMRKRYVRCRC